MRITLNLASRPHIDLGPYYQRLRLWMVLLAMLGVTIWLVTRNQQNKAAITVAEQEQLRQASERLQKEQQGFQILMHQPQNAAVLEQSEFLNHLFQQKSFSWTAVMMDLEKALPQGVQVSAIEPSISKTGVVSIRLRVVGPRDGDVEFLKNLEHTKRFLAPRIASESAETSNANGGPMMMQANTASQVTFDILADYNPLAKGEKPEAPAKEKEEKQQTGKTGSQPQSGAQPGMAGQRAVAPVGPARGAAPPMFQRPAAQRPPMMPQQPKGGSQ
jgi:type IV pilus assembly protein PilN